MNIGFIGLGIMGEPMAQNILKHHKELFIFNRTKSKAKSLVDNGAIFLDSPLDIGKKCEIVITMLSDPSVVEEMAMGELGFLNSLKQDGLWIDSSTVNPSFTRKMAAYCSNRDFRFIDAPVAGSKNHAIQAKLIFLLGGDKKVVDQVMHLFQWMGQKQIYVGSNGMGASFKMIVNLLLGHAFLGFSEAVNLGKSLGISQDFLLDQLKDFPVTAPTIVGKMEKIKNKEYSPEFPLKWLLKDLQLISQTAYENGVSMFSANIARDIYGLAQQKGLGDHDFSALFHFIEDLNQKE